MKVVCKGAMLLLVLVSVSRWASADPLMTYNFSSLPTTNTDPPGAVVKFGALGAEGLGNVFGLFEWVLDSGDNMKGVFYAGLENTSSQTSSITGFGFARDHITELSGANLASLGLVGVLKSNFCTDRSDVGTTGDCSTPVDQGNFVDDDGTFVEDGTDTGGFELFTSDQTLQGAGGGTVDFGGMTGVSLQAGSDKEGIHQGQFGVFAFAFDSINSLAGLTTASFIPGGGDPFWCVRWQGIGDAGDSDKACGSSLNGENGVPEPQTLALLGIGLIGMAAATRRRRATSAPLPLLLRK